MYRMVRPVHKIFYACKAMGRTWDFETFTYAQKPTLNTNAGMHVSRWTRGLISSLSHYRLRLSVYANYESSGDYLHFRGLV